MNKLTWVKQPGASVLPAQTNQSPATISLLPSKTCRPADSPSSKIPAMHCPDWRQCRSTDRTSGSTWQCAHCPESTGNDQSIDRRKYAIMLWRKTRAKPVHFMHNRHQTTSWSKPAITTNDPPDGYCGSRTMGPSRRKQRLQVVPCVRDVKWHFARREMNLTFCPLPAWARIRHN